MTYYGGPANGRTEENEVLNNRWAIAGSDGDVGWYSVIADMAFFTGELIARYYPYEGGNHED
jgi:hypothetical protein